MITSLCGQFLRFHCVFSLKCLFLSILLGLPVRRSDLLVLLMRMQVILDSLSSTNLSLPGWTERESGTVLRIFAAQCIVGNQDILIFKGTHGQ